MPADDVSDLRDVVDAINKLCDTMKTSYDEYEDCCDVTQVEHDELIQPTEVVVRKVDTYVAEQCTDQIRSDVDEDVAVSEDVVDTVDVTLDYTQNIQTTVSEPIEVETVPINLTGKDVCRSSDHIDETKMIRSDEIKEIKTIRSDQTDETETVVSDSELVTAEPTQYEPTSEMYYTASSELSLLSDIDVQERLCLTDDSERRRDDRNSVMAGHVAAMREHFESMTRTNTPCPELLRTSSPSFEVFRTVTNSPDN